MFNPDHKWLVWVKEINGKILCFQLSVVTFDTVSVVACIVLFLPFCFWNHPFQTKSASTEKNKMCPTVVVLLDQREGMSRTETPRRGCRSRSPASCLKGKPVVATSLPCIPKCCPASWRLVGTTFPVVGLLFGKAAVHSKPVIKVHSGNEKKMK